MSEYNNFFTFAVRLKIKKSNGTTSVSEKENPSDPEAQGC